MMLFVCKPFWCTKFQEENVKPLGPRRCKEVNSFPTLKLRGGALLRKYVHKNKTPWNRLMHVFQPEGQESKNHGLHWTCHFGKPQTFYSTLHCKTQQFEVKPRNWVWLLFGSYKVKTSEKLAMKTSSAFLSYVIQATKELGQTCQTVSAHTRITERTACLKMWVQTEENMFQQIGGWAE